MHDAPKAQTEIEKLLHCKTSFLHHQDWQPDPCIARNGPEKFVLADLMRYLDD